MKSKIWMKESMKAVAFMGMMPMIKIIIKKQRSADQRPVIDFYPFAFRIRISKQCNTKTMVIDTIMSMSDILLHVLIFAVMKNRHRDCSECGIQLKLNHFF